MKLVKAHQGQFVEVVGLVKVSALADNAPGKRVGNTTIKIGSAPRSTDPVQRQSGMAGIDVAVMDLLFGTLSLRHLPDSHSTDPAIGGDQNGRLLNCWK